MVWTPLVKEFTDIVVVPISKAPAGSKNKKDTFSPSSPGGPIWPDWKGASFERHWVGRGPNDTCPEAQPPAHIVADDNYFWAGFCIGHFGHQILEYSMRLRASRIIDPEAKFVFAINPGFQPRSWFHDIMRWLEIDASAIMFVREPLQFKRLRVVPQMEWRRGVEPPPGFLDAMDAFIGSKKLDFERFDEPLYVSRGGQPYRFAGENYLEQCLVQSGARVLRPEEHPLETQLTALFGAQRIIFAEGSAFHLCNLAGRNFGDIDVLSRRRGSRIGQAFLPARSRSVNFHDLIVGEAYPESRNKNISVLSENQLLDFFASRGVNLAEHWNTGDYHDAVVRDLQFWTKNVARQSPSAQNADTDGLLTDVVNAMSELPSQRRQQFRRWAERIFSRPDV